MFYSFNKLFLLLLIHLPGLRPFGRELVPHLPDLLDHLTLLLSGFQGDTLGSFDPDGLLPECPQFGSDGIIKYLSNLTPFQRRNEGNEVGALLPITGDELCKTVIAMKVEGEYRQLSTFKGKAAM